MAVLVIFFINKKRIKKNWKKERKERWHDTVKPKPSSQSSLYKSRGKKFLILFQASVEWIAGMATNLSRLVRRPLAVSFSFQYIQTNEEICFIFCSLAWSFSLFFGRRFCGMHNYLLWFDVLYSMSSFGCGGISYF